MSPEAPAADAPAASAQYVGLRLGEQRYAFPIQSVREIVVLGAVTPVPRTAEYVAGVANLRGTIIPVIDLRRLFGLPAEAAPRRTVVLAVGDRTMGCSVDAVDQVVRLADEAVQPAPKTLADGAPPYVRGFARHGEGILVILDADELLEPAHLAAVHAAAVQHADTAQAAETPDVED